VVSDLIPSPQGKAGR